MTVQTTEPTPASPAWSDEAEIDLRQYIDVLVRWRREIGLITLTAVVLAVAGVLALEWLRTPQYEANAEVAIVRTVSDVQFDERFTTEPQIPTMDSANARRLALVVLANSPAIAQEVIAQLGEQLGPDDRYVDKLVDMVKATLSSPVGTQANNSDLIRIGVTADTPETAALLANVWAEVFVRKANTVYGQVPDELFASVEAELTAAKAQYEIAQATLEQFLANNRSDELNRQILETQTLIDAYSASSTANRLAAFEAEQEGHRNAVTQYVEAVSGVQAILLEQQTLRNIGLLQNYYSSWITRTLALEDVRALRLQVANGGDAAAASSSLAVQLLKARLYAGLPGKFELQLAQPPARTADELVQDLDGLITALEEQRNVLAQQIKALGASMLSGENFVQLGESVPLSSTLVQSAQQALPLLFTLGDLTKQSEALAIVGTPTETTATDSLDHKLGAMQVSLRELKSQFEAENARQLQLTQQRDLAWEAFKTLSNKMTELNLTRAASNSEVRLASMAVSPVMPIKGPSLVLVMLLAGLCGLIVAIVVSFMSDYLGKSPPLMHS